MTNEDRYNLFLEWYNALPIERSFDAPARGSVLTGLIVLERMQNEFRTDELYFKTASEGQIKGLTRSAIARILEKFGENRALASEEGRTNRGNIIVLKNLLQTINQMDIDSFPPHERNALFKQCQQFLVERVKEYHERARIRMTYNPTKSTWENIHSLLQRAKENQKDGPVAQYLIGAKLQCRFPDIDIPNESSSTADDQTGRQGDFVVGHTAFHVTVAPQSGVYGRCCLNVEAGLQSYLLVPENKVGTARQKMEGIVAGQVTVISIESFVAQNVDEMSRFSSDKRPISFRHLFNTYNERVDAVETDKSLLIEIPHNLPE